MNTLNEALIERYVRFQSTLSERDIEEAERLLQASPAARDLADFFASFYEEFDATDDPVRPLALPDRPNSEGE